MLYWGHETTQITQNVKNKKIVWFGVWAFFQHPISICSFNSAEIEIQAWSSFFYCQDLSTLSFPNVRQQSNFDTFGTICRKKGFFRWKWIAFGRQCMAIVQSSFCQNGCWKRPPYLHTYYWKEIQMLAWKYLTSIQIDSWWNFSCTYIPMYMFSCLFFRTIFKLHWTDKSYEAQKPLCISSKWWTKCSPHSWVRKMRLQITSIMIWAQRTTVLEVMIIWALPGKFWISLKPCTKCWNKPFFSLIALEA